MKFCTKIFYINREDKKTYFVYDIVVYKSGDTDFTCVIYASCSVGNNKSVVFIRKGRNGCLDCYNLQVSPVHDRK